MNFICIRTSLVKHFFTISISILTFLSAISCSNEVPSVGEISSESFDASTQIVQLLSPVNEGEHISTTSDTLKFEWKNPYPGKYAEVMLSTVNPPHDVIGTKIMTNSFEYNTSNLEINKKYYWRVHIEKEAFYYYTSDVYSFTTDSGININELPNANEVALGSQNFSWKFSNKINKENYSFSLYISDNLEFNTAEIINISAASSSIDIDLTNISGLEKGRQYYAKLVAVSTINGKDSNDPNRILESSVYTFKTEVADRSLFLTGPANNALDISVGAVSFNWNVNTSITGATYTILVDTDVDRLSTNNAAMEIDTTGGINMPTSTSARYDYVSEDLEFEKTYYWKVIALKDGVEYQSAVFHFTIESGDIRISDNSPADGIIDFAIGNIQFAWTPPPSFDTSNTESALFIDTTPVALTKRAEHINGNSYVFDGNLDFGATYYWQIVSTKTIEGHSFSAKTDMRSFTTEEGIGLVSLASEATNQLVSGLKFEWNLNKSLQGAQSIFYLDQNPNPTTEKDAAIVGANYTLNEVLKFSTKYYWKVKSTKGAISSISEVRSFTTEEGIKLHSPTNNADDLEVKNSSFKWYLNQSLANSSNALYFGKDPSTLSLYRDNITDYCQLVDPISNQNKNAICVTLSNLLDFKTNYYWKVVSTATLNGASVSSESEVWSFKTQGNVLSTNGPKSGVRITNIEFEWGTNSATHGGSSTLYLDTSPNPTTIIQDHIQGNHYTYDTYLDFDTTYYWKVETRLNSVVSTTEVQSFTTEKGLSLKSPTKDLLDATTFKILFKWERSDSLYGATTSLYLDTSPNPSTLISSSISEDSYVYIPYLSPNTKYYWKIISTKNINGTQVQAESEVWNFTTNQGPHINLLTPADRTSDVEHSNINFEWDYIDGPAGSTSTLYLDTNSNPTTEIASNISGSSYQFKGNLQFGTRYYWKIVSTYATMTNTSPVYYFDVKVANINVKGYVTSSKGGPGIWGTTVSLESLDGSIVYANTTTRNDGSFNLMSLEGDFAIVAKKSGRATSRTEIYVDSSMPVLGLQQFEVNYAGRSLDPPEVKVLDGDLNVFENNKIVGQNGDNFDLFYDVSASNPLTPMGRRNSLSITLNTSNSLNTVLGHKNSFENKIDRSSIRIQSNQLPAGKSYIEFMVYDNNNNQTKKIITVINAFQGEQKGNIWRPGTGPNPIGFTAYTYGKEVGYYSLAQDTSAFVNMSVYARSNDGIMIYRGTHSRNIKYITSSTDTVTSNVGTMFNYIDTSPELVDGEIYIYKFKYFKQDTNDSKVYTSEFSDEFRVPILPRFELSYITPYNGDVLYNPQTINFEWRINANLNNLFADSSYIDSTVLRKDSLQMIEVGSQILYHTDSLYVPGVNADSGVFRSVYDLSFETTPIKNKRFYWFVSSEISYVKSVTNVNVNYHVKSYSTPHGSLNPVFDNVAQEGVAYFTIR